MSNCSCSVSNADLATAIGGVPSATDIDSFWLVINGQVGTWNSQ